MVPVWAVILVAVVLLGAGLAIGASAFPRTVRHTMAGPTVTETQTVPGPTVTETVSPPPPPAPAVVFNQSGTGDWNSPPFAVTGSVLTVVFTYSSNQDSNFAANLTSDQGDYLSIANEIGSSGGKTTTLYPSGQGGNYHLEVMAQDDWTFKISQSG